MWEDTKLEAYVKENLEQAIGKSKAENAYSSYVVARDAAMKVALEIKAKEPNLSDHGPEHIRDVLENAWDLVRDQDLCILNLYVLCVAIAYHDIGNFFGRDKHNQKIAGIFNDTFPDHEELKRPLRALVTKIAGAHTGKALDGTDNTLQDLNDDALHLFKKPIKAQNLAAMLRFADEMAEGPQRTSGIRIKQDDYEEKSRPFQIYASCCQPCASHRMRESFFLHYLIPIEFQGEQIEHRGTGMPLSDLLTLIYKRVIKFDQERKYCRYYSEYLGAFKQTSVLIEFFLNDEEVLPIGLEPLILSDLVVPGDASKAINDIDSNYNVVNITDKLLEISK